ncbi:MAG: hybrid sensor histidine kinase/response regulator [Bosea sp.]|uniref:hybrid sensor histidine kinase/response regulator n=1 Tax=Bosea sp. (in: a-proteobacteria) TaxID=1871050 RepID=UPI002393AD49|nr:hybrid sensor histidine kinase/response regulator [Bosea sp. (in: a-proteobacteria)]MCP4733782.1 hybrid sensor histidine kinase/response regulator [Bosea sp. (in: a-proteobacteria)]
MMETPAPAGREKRVQAGLIDLLFRQSRAILLANFVIPWPVAYVLREAVPAPQLLAWIGAIYVLTGARFLVSRSYFRRGAEAAGPLAWAHRFTLLSILSSLLWGAIGWIGFVPEQPHLIAFVCIVLTGMSGGAVPSLSAYPPAYAGLLVAMQLPFVLRCLQQEEAIYSVYLVFAACLLGVYLYYSLVTYRALRETVSLRFENLALVEGLERERDRATAADRAKTRFLAAASHDLRQPIHAVALFTASLATLARRGDVTAAAAKGIAGKLEAALASLDGLLHGLVDVSRLDAGLVPISRRPVHLRRMLSDLGEEYALQVRERGVALSLVASDAWIESDPVLLKRILDNFLSNALRYAPAGRILIGCRRRGDALEIQVVDTGPGIPAGEHQAVFEEFTQLDNPQRDREQGLGLGLAIVRRLGDLLGHKVGLNSALGRGSIFWVRVPVTSAVTSGLEPGRSAEPPPTLRIMVLDDDAQALDGLSTLLATWGYEVFAGRDVEDLCSRHAAAGGPPVHLAIADYRLGGGIIGSEAIVRLSGYLGHSIPALIVTGDTSPERLRELTATGRIVLHKPVAPECLRAAIHQAVGTGESVTSPG